MTHATPAVVGTADATLEHIERITSEHSRMAELLAHVHACHHGSPQQRARTAQEYGLEPDAGSRWRDQLEQLIGVEIDLLLTEVHAPLPEPVSAPAESPTC